MKKISFIFVLIGVLLISSMAIGDSPVVIRIDSENLMFNQDIGFPFVDENSRTQVPFRATMERFGAKVTWDKENQIAIAEKDNIVVKVPIGENFILKDDNKTMTDTKALIKDGRTYLPIRPVIEAFGSSVEWDGDLRTVVITTEEIDAREILLEAYKKSNEWKNFNSNTNIKTEVSLPKNLGTVGNILMNLQITNFNEPLKTKISLDTSMNLGGLAYPQEKEEIYYQLEGDKFVNYISTSQDGKTNWIKQTTENKLLQNMEEDKEENIKLLEESIKDVKYYGKYKDEKGRILLRIENTNSFNMYKEYFGGLLDLIPSLMGNKDIVREDIVSELGDMKYIVYIDEKTGEISRYNMDLSNMINPMFKDTIQLLQADGFTPTVKAVLDMEILNINKAKDFQLPEEALKAIEIPIN